MEHGSKEYYKMQNKYWYNEATKFLKERDIIKDKFDKVVDLFKTFIYHKRKVSNNSIYDSLEIKLNQILDGYPVKTTRLKRMYLTEIEQALINKNLDECLFLLEKIQMDLEEDE